LPTPGVTKGWSSGIFSSLGGEPPARRIFPGSMLS
jgi:hypothetical protein